MIKKLFLIGGAPCSGKSTYAINLAKETNTSWISTDVIRDWMKNFVSKKDSPQLFSSTGISADDFYKKYSPSEVFRLEILQSKDVEPGIIAFIETIVSYGHWDDYIIEGIALTPDFISELKKRYAEIFEVVPVVLVQTNEEEIKRRIVTRGLWDDADKYSDWIKPLEIEWVIECNKWFKSEAEKHGITVNVD